MPNYTDVKDLVRDTTLRAMDLDLYRQAHPQEEAPAVVSTVEAEAKDLARRDAGFASLLSAPNGCVLDLDGNVLAAPPRDLGALQAAWLAATNPQPGQLCVPGGVLAVAFTLPTGWDWLIEKATEPAPTFRSRLSEWMSGDRADIPPEIDEDAPRDTRPRIRDQLGHSLTVGTPVPPARPWQHASYYGQRQFREALATMRGPASKIRLRILVWRWPDDGWKIRPGTVADGVRIMEALPSDAARCRVRGDECVWAHVHPASTQDAPSWVLESIGAKRVRS